MLPECTRMFNAERACNTSAFWGSVRFLEQHGLSMFIDLNIAVDQLSLSHSYDMHGSVPVSLNRKADEGEEGDALQC